MPPMTTQKRGTGDGWTALGLSALAVVVYHPLAMFAPGWWRGARFSDMEPPFDLLWLHNMLAWLAGHVGLAVWWVFLAVVVLLPVVAVGTRGFRAVPPVVERMVSGVVVAAGLAVLAVPALAVAWFLVTQVAALLAPYLGMYHGDYRPAVP